MLRFSSSTWITWKHTLEPSVATLRTHWDHGLHSSGIPKSDPLANTSEREPWPPKFCFGNSWNSANYPQNLVVTLGISQFTPGRPLRFFDSCCGHVLSKRTPQNLLLTSWINEQQKNPLSSPGTSLVTSQHRPWRHHPQWLHKDPIKSLRFWTFL